MMVLRCLNRVPQFQGFVAVQRDKDASLDLGDKRKLEEELRSMLASIPVVEEPEEVVASFAASKSASRGRGHGGRARRGASRGNNGRVCYRCGSTEHLQRDCTMDDNKPEKLGNKPAKTGGLAGVVY